MKKENKELFAQLDEVFLNLNNEAIYESVQEELVEIGNLETIFDFACNYADSGIDVSLCVNAIIDSCDPYYNLLYIKNVSSADINTHANIVKLFGDKEQKKQLKAFLRCREQEEPEM